MIRKRAEGPDTYVGDPGTEWRKRGVRHAMQAEHEMRRSLARKRTDKTRGRFPWGLGGSG